MPNMRSREPAVHAIAHRLEDVQFVIVEGDHVNSRRKDADLARQELAVLVGRIVQHDEALPLVEVELAPLMGVKTSPSASGCRLKAMPRSRNMSELGRPNVDPGPSRRPEMEAAFVDLDAMQHLHVVGRILDQGEVERLVGNGARPPACRVPCQAWYGDGRSCPCPGLPWRHQTSVITWTSGDPAR